MSIFDEKNVIELIKEIKLIIKDKPLIFTIRSKMEGGEISIDDDIEVDNKVDKFVLKSGKVVTIGINFD